MRLPAILAFCIVITAGSWPTGSYGSALPEACNEMGSLDENDPNVISRQKKFSDYNDIEYPFETISTWARDPRSEHVICLRYEIKNIGTEIIKEFRWYDIGLYNGRDISPADTPFKKLEETYSRADNATESRSRVRAFENADQWTQAYFAVEQVSEGEELKKNEFTAFNYKNYSDKWLKYLAENNLLSGPIMASTKPIDKYEYYPIRTRFIVSDFDIISETEARYDGEQFHVSTAILFQGADAVYAPALTVVKAMFSGPVDNEAVYAAAKTISSLIDKPLVLNENKAAISFSFSPTNGDLPSLYMMEHPVTVKVKDRTLCVRVKSYSPIPLYLGREYCNL